MESLHSDSLLRQPSTTGLAILRVEIEDAFGALKTRSTAYQFGQGTRTTSLDYGLRSLHSTLDSMQADRGGGREDIRNDPKAAK